MQSSSPSEALNKNQDIYDYCYYQDNPRSLIMIKKPKIIYNYLYKQGTYIWVIDDKSTLSQEQISKKSQIQINYVESVRQIIQKYSSHQQKIVIICNQNIIYEVERLLRPMFKSNKINCIIFIGESTKQFQFIRQTNPQYADTEQQAITQIRTSVNYYSSPNFLNFIQIHDKIQESHILVNTIFSMLLMDTNVQQIIKKLKQLALLCFPQFDQHIKDFQKKYQQVDSLSLDDALRWYTEQSFLYRLINRLLRVCQDPTCIFIIQPYFKDLFMAVNQIYKNEKGKENYKNFTCFRGGEISENEVKMFQKNIGSLVQNLGFLSTSRLEQIAINFANKCVKKAIFIIHVDDSNKKQQIDYGYADIAKFSKEGEAQVLFNPLNSFKIISFSFDTNQKMYRIELKYGQLARVASMQKNTLTTQQQKNNRIFGINQMSSGLFYMQKKQKTGLEFYIFQDYEQYIDKFLQIAKKPKDQQAIADAKYSKSRIFFNKNDYKAAQKQCTQILQIYYKILQQCNQKDSIRISSKIPTLQKTLAINYVKQRNFQLGLQYYLKFEKIERQLFGQYHDEYIRTLTNLGNIFIEMRKYKKANKYLLKCQKISREKLGQDHQTYAKILNSLAITCQQLGQILKAKEYSKTSMNIIKHSMGNNHQQYAITLFSLGKLFEQQREYSNSIQCYRICQKIQGQSLGQNHPHYILTLSSLGISLLNIGQQQKAFQMLQKVQKIQRQIFGQYHPEYIQSLLNLASTFSPFKPNDKYINLVVKCLKIQKLIYGEDHKAFLSTLGYLQNYIFYLGKNKQPQWVLQKWTKLMPKSKPPAYIINLSDILADNPHLRQVFQQIQPSQGELKIQLTSDNQIQKNTINDLGKDLFLAQFRKFEKTKRQLVGHNLQYAQTLINLGKTLLSFEQQMALKYLVRAQKILQKQMEKNNPIYAKNFNILGDIFISLGEYQKGIKKFLKSLKIGRQSLGQDHPQNILILKRLGKLFFSLNQYQMSQKYLRKCQKNERQLLGEDHPNFLQTLSSLFILSCAMGKAKQSLYWAKRSGNKQFIKKSKQLQQFVDYLQRLNKHQMIEFSQNLKNAIKKNFIQNQDQQVLTKIKFYLTIASDLQNNHRTILIEKMENLCQFCQKQKYKQQSDHKLEQLSLHEDEFDDYWTIIMLDFNDSEVGNSPVQSQKVSKIQN